MRLLFVLIAFLQQTPPPPTPDLGGIREDMSGYSATAEALQDNGVSTNGQQIYDESGRPLLPDSQSEEMITTFGYMKWFMAINSARAVFGPFSPIVQHVRIFFVLTLVWLSSYFVLRTINIVLHAAVWVAENWMAALIIIIISAVIGFIAYIQARFSFFTSAVQWIMSAVQWIMNKLDWIF